MKQGVVGKAYGGNLIGKESADISQGFEEADICWFQMEITGLKAEKRTAYSSDHRFFGLPDSCRYLNTQRTGSPAGPCGRMHRIVALTHALLILSEVI
jgi:hypothetical protein